jgi:hypothetical protein
MDAFLPFPSSRAEATPQRHSTSSKPDETTPLLVSCADVTDSPEAKWKPGPGFIWIEIGTTRQAHCYVPDTDTDSYLLQCISFGV